MDTVTVDGVLQSDYSYDANGNRLEKWTPGGSEVGVFDDQDRVVSYGDNTYTFDDAGYLTSKTSPEGVTTYDHDLMGNLREGVLPDGRVVEYEIDAANRRVGKKVDGIVERRWLYRDLYKDSLNPVAELDALNNVLATFIYTEDRHVPSFMVKDGQIYRFATDDLGSVRMIINVSDGYVAQRLDYDEFGFILTDTNPGFQPFGFAGGLYDPDTGLVRFGLRDYDAETGRWTAKDPNIFRGGQPNLYVYVGNDPINYFDPSGLFRDPRDIYNEALEDAQNSGLPGPRDGLQDAYRHCLASCMMTMENGDLTSEFLGWANEKRGDWFHNQECGAREMDDFNNERGREYGRVAQNTDDCRYSCMKAAQNNLLRTYSSGTTEGYWY